MIMTFDFSSVFSFDSTTNVFNNELDTVLRQIAAIREEVEKLRGAVQELTVEIQVL